jgi:4-hydroxy-2-oxoheptanedioate aldolase
MNKVREIWNRGDKAVGGWMQISGALPAETLARCGYDALVIDMQHSGTEFDAAVAMMTAIELAGCEPFVRVRWNSPSEIMKLADLGAYGIIAPMVETAEEAALLASALHYPPRGQRSFGPRRPLLRYGADYISKASDTIVSMAMIETQKGIDNLESILAVDGLDGVFIGPADLSLALGGPPKPDSTDPKVVSAIRHIRERAHAMGKRVGIFCGSPLFGRQKLQEGFDLVTLTPDLTMLAAAAKDAVTVARNTDAN